MCVCVCIKFFGQVRSWDTSRAASVTAFYDRSGSSSADVRLSSSQEDALNEVTRERESLSGGKENTMQLPLQFTEHV